MKDFRGIDLSEGDMVAWTVGKSKMWLGKIVGFTVQKAQVHSHDGYGKPHFNTDRKPTLYLVDSKRIAKL